MEDRVSNGSRLPDIRRSSIYLDVIVRQNGTDHVKTKILTDVHKAIHGSGRYMP